MSLPYGVFQRFDAWSICKELGHRLIPLLPDASEPDSSRFHLDIERKKKAARALKKKKGGPQRKLRSDLDGVEDTPWAPTVEWEDSINIGSSRVSIRLAAGWLKRFRCWMIQCSACRRWGRYVLIVEGRATCKRQACLHHKRKMPRKLRPIQEAMEAELRNKHD